MDVVLVTGASGLLGHSLCRFLSTRAKVIGASLTHSFPLPDVKEIKLDLLDGEALIQAFTRYRPTVVIHTAGLTQVDQCEQEPGLAQLMNVQTTRAVARMSREFSSKLVHISTDHLFDGSEPLSTEAKPVKPMNVYASTKAQAESEALEGFRALVLRTNFFGPGLPWRKSFSDWITGALGRGEGLKLFSDSYITPLTTQQACELLWELVEKKAEGVFNLAGGERISKLDLGRKLARAFELPFEGVESVSVDSVSLKAVRPKDMSLSVKKLEAFLGRAVPTLDQGIAEMAKLSKFDRKDLGA